MRLWSLIFIDFVIKLLLLKELIINIIFNLIIVAVDRLIRNIIFILFKEIATAEKLMCIFLRNIIAEYTLLEELNID